MSGILGDVIFKAYFRSLGYFNPYDTLLSLKPYNENVKIDS